LEDVLDLTWTERLVDDHRDRSNGRHPEEGCCRPSTALEENGDAVVGTNPYGL
jgi:hypothetical protein